MRIRAMMVGAASGALLVLSGAWFWSHLPGRDLLQLWGAITFPEIAAGVDWLALALSALAFMFSVTVAAVTVTRPAVGMVLALITALVVSGAVCFSAANVLLSPHIAERVSTELQIGSWVIPVRFDLADTVIGGVISLLASGILVAAGSGVALVAWSSNAGGSQRTGAATACISAAVVMAVIVGLANPFPPQIAVAPTPAHAGDTSGGMQWLSVFLGIVIVLGLTLIRRLRRKA
jgi:hypothetical protein